LTAAGANALARSEFHTMGTMERKQQSPKSLKAEEFHLILLFAAQYQAKFLDNPLVPSSPNFFDILQRIAVEGDCPGLPI
jgi:hypothetical protein